MEETTTVEPTTTDTPEEETTDIETTADVSETIAETLEPVFNDEIPPKVDFFIDFIIFTVFVALVVVVFKALYRFLKIFF